MSLLFFILLITKTYTQEFNKSSSFTFFIKGMWSITSASFTNMNNVLFLNSNCNDKQENTLCGYLNSTYSSHYSFLDVLSVNKLTKTRDINQFCMVSIIQNKSTYLKLSNINGSVTITIPQNNLIYNGKYSFDGSIYCTDKLNLFIHNYTLPSCNTIHFSSFSKNLITLTVIWKPLTSHFNTTLHIQSLLMNRVKLNDNTGAPKIQQQLVTLIIVIAFFLIKFIPSFYIKFKQSKSRTKDKSLKELKRDALEFEKKITEIQEREFYNNLK